MSLKKWAFWAVVLSILLAPAHSFGQFTFNGLSVSGKIVDQDNSGIGYAQVKLYRRDSTFSSKWLHVATSTADHFGNYSIQSIFTGWLNPSWRLIASDGEVYAAKYYTMKGSLTNQKIQLDQVRRLAFIFQASDYSFPQNMDNYRDQLLTDEDFDAVIPLLDIDDWQSMLGYLDAWENENDRVFIVMRGHGVLSSGGPSVMNVSGQSTPGSWGQKLGEVNSLELAAVLDHFDSTNILVIIESCYSGYFVDHLKGPGRCIISSANRTQKEWDTNRFGIRYFAALDAGFDHDGAFDCATRYFSSLPNTAMIDDQLAEGFFGKGSQSHLDCPVVNPFG